MHQPPRGGDDSGRNIQARSPQAQGPPQPPTPSPPLSGKGSSHHLPSATHMSGFSCRAANWSSILGGKQGQPDITALSSLTLPHQTAKHPHTSPWNTHSRYRSEKRLTCHTRPRYCPLGETSQNLRHWVPLRLQTQQSAADPQRHLVTQPGNASFT